MPGLPFSEATHEMATCPVLQPFLFASASTSFTRRMFCSKRPGWKRGKSRRFSGKSSIFLYCPVYAELARLARLQTENDVPRSRGREGSRR